MGREGREEWQLLGKRHDFLPYSISYIQSQRQDRDKLYHFKTTKFHFFQCYATLLSKENTIF